MKASFLPSSRTLRLRRLSARLLLHSVLLSAGLFTIQTFAEDPGDPYRPLLHYTPPADWLNDPNGLFRVGPEWHLQYQYTWPRQWGHAKSLDLLHWETLPVALVPDSAGDIWSGCTTRDERNTSGFFKPGTGGLVSVYASWKKPKQHISLAYSADEGATWQRPPGNPVLDTGSEDFRDPKVLWHDGSKQWSMVVAAGKQLEFYTSPNLRQWTRSGEFGKLERPEQVFECPDLFRLPVDGAPGKEKWVLLSSVNEHDVCEARYWVGEFDGAIFHSETPAPKLLAFGPDDYAGITWPRDPATGRTVLISWMNSWTYADKAPTKPWKGCMTMPRELTLGAGKDGQWMLWQPAVRELWMAPHESSSVEFKRLEASDGRKVLTKLRTGGIRAVLHPEAGSKVEFEMFASEHGKTIVGYDSAKGVLYFDRRDSGGPKVNERFPLRREAALPLDADRALAIELVWDRSTVEVFASKGAVYLSGLVFPDAAAEEVAVSAKTGSVAVDKLEIVQWK